MSKASYGKSGNRIVFQAGLWTFLTWLVTAVHHFYTGLLYQTMWRAAFAAYAIIPMVMCVLLLYLYSRCKNKAVLGAYLFISFSFFFPVVGLWEGAWCHAVKIVMYAFGLPFSNAPASWNVPAAPAPTDVFSEATGVLNFAAAGAAALVNWRLAKSAAGCGTCAAGCGTCAAGCGTCAADTCGKCARGETHALASIGPASGPAHPPV